MDVLEVNASDLIRRIERVFAKARLEDGISMAQARAIDDYKPRDEAAKEKRKDTEKSWLDVTDEKIEHYCDVLSFLDDKGFRFYLPAFMRFWLRNPESDSSATSSVLFHLNPIRTRKGTYTPDPFSLEKYGLLNAEQRQVVRDFLKWVIWKGDESEAADARLALDHYWSK